MWKYVNVEMDYSHKKARGLASRLINIFTFAHSRAAGLVTHYFLLPRNASSTPRCFSSSFSWLA